jgi:hypothetical protein
LGKPRDGDIEIVAVLAPYVPYEVDAISEATFDCLPFVLADGWVASKR